MPGRWGWEAVGEVEEVVDSSWVMRWVMVGLVGVRVLGERRVRRRSRGCGGVVQREGRMRGFDEAGDGWRGGRGACVKEGVGKVIGVLMGDGDDGERYWMAVCTGVCVCIHAEAGQ